MQKRTMFKLHYTYKGLGYGVLSLTWDEPVFLTVQKNDAHVIQHVVI